MFKNKKILIISSLALMVLIIIVVIFVSGHKSSGNKALNNSGSEVVLPPKVVGATPEFLTDSEKTQLGIPAAEKIQTLERDASGAVTVYKIIKNDSDIVSDRTKIGPISPNQKPGN